MHFNTLLIGIACKSTYFIQASQETSVIYGSSANLLRGLYTFTAYFFCVIYEHDKLRLTHARVIRLGVDSGKAFRVFE
jgi:hypothetical protein